MLVDLVEYFPVPPEDRGRTSPERPVADGFRNAAIVFNKDHQRITVFRPHESENDSAVDVSFRGQPAAVFEVSSGQLVTKAVRRNFRPVAVTPIGDKLIGARRKN